MSTTKRRKLDADTASNASGGGGGRNSGSGNNAASTASGRRGGGGPGSRGGHSAATASRAAAAASAVNPASSGMTAPASLAGGQMPSTQPYVPVLSLSALPMSALSKYALHYGLVPPEPLTVAQATYPTPALPLQLKLADSYTVPAQRGRTSTAEGRRNRSPFTSARGTHQPSPSTSSVQPAAVRASGEQRSEEHLNADPSSSRLAVNGVNGDLVAASSATSTPTNAASNSRSSSNQGVNPEQHVLYQQSAEWVEPGEADAHELRGMTAFEGGEEQLKDRLGLLARTHWDKLASIKEAETVVNFAYAIRMRSKILKSAPMV